MLSDRTYCTSAAHGRGGGTGYNAIIHRGREPRGLYYAAFVSAIRQIRTYTNAARVENSYSHHFPIFTLLVRRRMGLSMFCYSSYKIYLIIPHQKGIVIRHNFLPLI